MTDVNSAAATGAQAMIVDVDCLDRSNEVIHCPSCGTSDVAVAWTQSGAPRRILCRAPFCSASWVKEPSGANVSPGAFAPLTSALACDEVAL